MNKFTRTINGKKDATLKDIFTVASQGRTQVTFEVEGFWGVSVRVVVDRDIFTEQWEFKITHSSGGHEKGFDEVKRTKNFAAALIDAANVVDFLKAHVDELETAFQDQQEKVEAILAKVAN